MPGHDRTGPRGQGPKTGGGFGYCGNLGRDADTAAMDYGRGLGPGGRGRQRGFRRGFCFFGRGRGGIGYGAPWFPEATQPNLIKSNLEAEAEELRRRLDALEQRLAGMQVPGVEPKPA